MKNVFQKIATVIIVAIGIIFAIVIGIIAYTIINNIDVLGGVFTYDRIGFTLLLVLGIVYLLLSAYLIFSLFGSRVSLKTMVLTSDNFSAVSTTNRVVRRLIKICVASIGGMRLNQTKITEDDKPGFKLGIKIRVFDGNIHKQTQKLKFLLEDSFKRELAFSFNSIVIKVTTLRSSFKPDIKRAQNYIDAKEKEEECKADCKIAEATPSDQTVIEENLTTEELNNVSRPPNQDNTEEKQNVGEETSEKQKEWYAGSDTQENENEENNETIDSEKTEDNQDSSEEITTTDEETSDESENKTD